MFQDQEAPVFDVRFGNETLSIKSCRKKLLYEYICGVLHGSINSHLKMNPILREQFGLGPTTEIFPTKVEKSQRVIPYFFRFVRLNNIGKSCSCDFGDFVADCYTKCNQQNKRFTTVKATRQTHHILTFSFKLCLIVSFQFLIISKVRNRINSNSKTKFILCLAGTFPF